MGLTSWRRSSQGKIMPGDTVIAKNYLDKKELGYLNRIGNMYLDYAEMQAARGKAMTMEDWIKKLNAFLKFSEYDILINAGKIYAKYTNLNLELSQYQITLEDSPYFSRVQQVACETDMYSPIPTADFELVCQLTY